MASSQSQYMRYWLGASISKNVHKKVRVTANVQTRFGEYRFDLYNNFVQLRGLYMHNDYYRVGVNYRYAKWGIANTQRIDLDNHFRYPLRKSVISARIRLQRTFTTENFSEDRARLRLQYRYKFSKRLHVYGKAEYFYSHRYNFSNFDMQRYTAGTRFRVALKHFVNVFGRFENQHNVRWPEQRFILGVSYSFRL